MILVFDTGNTHIHIGMFTLGKLRATWKLATDTRRTSDEYAYLLQGILGTDIETRGAIISSVVPPITPILTEAVEKVCSITPMVLRRDTQMGIINGYQHPEEVGMDRLANAVGGNFFFGAPLLILDFGTANTLDYLAEPEARGMLPVYRGGAIMPGMRMSADALGAKTAMLPTIDLSEPERVIGATTVQSIRSGLIHGGLGAIQYIVDRAREEIGLECRVVSTGGDSLWLRDHMPYLHAVEPNLKLFGLRHIYGLNHNCPLSPE